MLPSRKMASDKVQVTPTRLISSGSLTTVLLPIAKGGSATNFPEVYGRVAVSLPGS